MSVKEEFIGSIAETLFKVKRNEVRMMRDRGVLGGAQLAELLPMLDSSYTIDQFIQYYKALSQRSGKTFKGAMSIDYQIGNSFEYYYVAYVETPAQSQSTGNNQVEEVLRNITTKHTGGKYISRAIVISEYKLSAQAKKELNSVRGLKIVEHFLYQDLKVNVMDHFLVPKYRVMTQEEITNLTRSSGINFADFPHMLINDPSARYLGLVHGQMVEVTRFNFQYSTINKTSISYLAVVADSGLKKESILTAEAIAKMSNELVAPQDDNEEVYINNIEGF